MSAPDAVGYGNPPRATRFKRGSSGNPKGRPKNRRREIPYNAVLGQMVTIRENGCERRVTAAEAFLLQLTQKGLAGDSAAAHSSLSAIEAARKAQPEQILPERIVVTLVNLGISTIVGELGLAVKRFPKDEKRVRWELQPWLVEAALKRLGERQLSQSEQLEVWANTCTPEKVNWPQWWTIRG